MSWNYRVLRRTLPGTSEAEYNVHEVYYDEVGNPMSCTYEPVFPSGETPEELHDDMKRYVAAISMPILDWYAFESEVS